MPAAKLCKICVVSVSMTVLHNARSVLTNFSISVVHTIFTCFQVQRMVKIWVYISQFKLVLAFWISDHFTLIASRNSITNKRPVLFLKIWVWTGKFCYKLATWIVDIDIESSLITMTFSIKSKNIWLSHLRQL